MVVDAVLLLDDLLPLSMIGVKKVPGGALEVSQLIYYQVVLLFCLSFFFRSFFLTPGFITVENDWRDCPELSLQENILVNSTVKELLNA